MKFEFSTIMVVIHFIISNDHHQIANEVHFTRSTFECINGNAFTGCLYSLNPSNAEATFFQSTKTQLFLKTIETLSCWYTFESSCWVLSDEYPFARVLVILRGYLHLFVLAKLATSSIRVNNTGIDIKWCTSSLSLLVKSSCGVY